MNKNIIAIAVASLGFIIGLGLLGTMTVGAPISIGIGVGFNVPTNKMVFWCSLGVLIRCALFTTLGHYSLQLF